MPELTCPVCGGVLHREEHSLRCGAGHCYDIARQGYVNLLRSNQSKSKRHGDDKRMVAARTAFLDAGYYAPLRDAVAAAAAEFTAGDADVLDAGCGEGYYTAQVLHTLQQQGRTPSVCGVDISRDALICAHRRAPELTLAVASIAHLPVADASCDLLLNVFAPHDADEFARVLRPQGVLLRVIPLFLKIPVLHLFNYLSDREITASFSNIGKVDMPAQLHPYIRLFDIFFVTRRMQTCMATFGDTFVITFTTPFVSADVQREFFRTLTGMGIDATITSNLAEFEEAD